MFLRCDLTYSFASDGTIWCRGKEILTNCRYSVGDRIGFTNFLHNSHRILLGVQYHLDQGVVAFYLNSQLIVVLWDNNIVHQMVYAAVRLHCENQKITLLFNVEKPAQNLEELTQDLDRRELDGVLLKNAKGAVTYCITPPWGYKCAESIEVLNKHFT